MTESRNRNEHILVVDHDIRIRQMLIRYFEEEGCRVSAVADGQAMREYLQGVSVDIILLDLVLPGGDDGLALAREVRSRSDVPIIMLTGRVDVVDRIVGLEIGAIVSTNVLNCRIYDIQDKKASTYSTVSNET